MADNTVYINRVTEIPTPASPKGIYLYVDQNSESRGFYVVANEAVTDMLLDRITRTEFTLGLEDKANSSDIENLIELITTKASLSDIIPLLDEKVNVLDLTTLLEDFVSIETVNELIVEGLKNAIVSSVVNVNGEDIFVDSAQQILNLTGSAYSSEHPLLSKVGGLSKGSSYVVGTTILGLLNSMFFPNIGKTFPTNPVFIGFSETYPTTETILSLDLITDYYEFDYNKYTENGYVIIALPGENYLKRIEDSNGMNIIGAFNIIYKSILSDIYNVYISPFLHYTDNLDLTLTSKIGIPVQTLLSEFNISINQTILPVLNSFSFEEVTRSIINNIIIGEQPILNSFTFTNITRSSLNSINVSDVVRSTLNSINISELSILNSVSVIEISKSILNSVTINTITRSNLNSITVVDGASKLNSIIVESGISKINSIIISDIIRSIINGVTIAPWTT